MNNNESSYKGFNSPLKVQVTRIDDPRQMNRIQVYIPSYHGKFEEDMVGYGDDLGNYPWASMCSILFKDGNNFTSGSLEELYSGDLPMIFPSVGTIGWVMFEGGDVRAPIYMGSLGKGEVNEKVEGSYTGSDNSNQIVATGSSELTVMANIIFEQEGGGKNYGNINPLDVDAISIGVLQWHADNGRELMIRIRDANPGTYNHLVNYYHATFSLDKSWSGFYVKKDDANYNCIKALLTGTEGQQCQDAYVNEYLSNYIEQGKTVGVVDYKAQIYFCDMYNQSPAGAMKIAKVCSNKSIDGLHQETLNGGHWLGGNQYHNRDRRIRVYNKVKTMDMQAELNSVTSTTLPGALSLDTTFAFPLEAKDVKVPYVKLIHPYITIQEDGIEGMEVKAAHKGIAKAFNDSAKNGKWISIKSGKYETRYMHLRNFSSKFPALQSGVEVEVGDVIGYVGHTGNVSTACLDFQILVNGNAKDPIPYLNGVSNNLNTTGNGVIDTAVNWMINVANDPQYGYSQAADMRWGNGAYDCSSLVISGYTAAGIDVKSAGATYTGNMRSAFVSCGFTAIPFSASMELIRGDVLLNEIHHTACYIGNNQIVHASSSRGHPEKGDQTGDEVYVRDMYIYSKGWDYVLRYTGS